jgi:serine/threonine protein kinase
MALTAGTRLGPYEVIAPIGAGGMGEVYSAKDTRLDRTVALKILPLHLADTPEVRQRFEREARAVSSLNHPNICALYDIGQQDGTDFLVMEYLEGQTLAKRIEQGPMPTPELLRVAIQVCEALEKAHRQGVIHRDLKPGNVMLTKAGAKLLDFGLAKGAAPAVTDMSSSPTVTQPLPGSSRGNQLTVQGTIVGTLQYMPPEQLEGGEADARSDIFSFGATLYDMATGQKAFPAKSQASLIAEILKAQPRPISELQPLVPPALERIVTTCLAKDPDDRWQSAGDLKRELVWISSAGSLAGVPAPVIA